MSRTSANKAMATIAGISALALIVTACSSSSSTAASSTSSSSAAAAASSAPAAAPATFGTCGFLLRSGLGRGIGLRTGAPQPPAYRLGRPQPPSDDATYCDTIKKNWPDISGKNVTVYAGIDRHRGHGAGQVVEGLHHLHRRDREVHGDKNFEQQIVVQAKSGNAAEHRHRAAAGPAGHPGRHRQGRRGRRPQVAATTSTSTGITAAGSLRHRRRQVLRRPARRQRQVAGLVLAEDVRGQGLHGPDHLGRDDRAVRQDRRRPVRRQAVVCRCRVRCAPPAGPPPTGWKRSSCVRPAPTSTTSGSRTRCKFSRPQIAKALATVGSIWKNPKYVNAGIGDVSSIATTTFADGGLADPDRQVLHDQQAYFYETELQGHTRRSPRPATSSPSTSRHGRHSSASRSRSPASSTTAFSSQPRCRRSSGT